MIRLKPSSFHMARRRAGLACVVLPLALGLGLGSSCTLLPGLPFFEDDEDETEELLTLLGLAALAAANAAPAARDRFVIATSLLNGAPSGQVFMFRKATESCDLVQTHQINTGQNPYDLIVSPGGEHVYIALDGDQAIAPFSIDAATEQLTALSPAAQAGTVATTPYGMSIHPNGRWLYSADGSAPGSVASFDRDPVTGALTPQTPAFLAAGDNMYYATLDRTGGFLYVSNYNGVGDAGNDTVYGYAVNQTTGALTSLGAPVATQNRPWYIARHPTGNFIYVGNQGSGTISMFTVNTGTGALTPIGAGTVAAAGNPIGLAVGQRFAFAADNGGGNIYGYTIDSATGLLTANGTTNPGAPVPYGLSLDTDERCLYVARTDESGATSTDVITMYDVSPTGALSFRGNLSAGVGPRFLAIVRR
ncbi:MAG: beta-propeller fold lactonase family protein [Leptospirales bacterium]